MGRFTHVSEALHRHSSPGSLLLILFAVILFGPRTWDAVRGEPSIENQLAVVVTSSGDVLIQDVTMTNQPVSGLRANMIEAEDGAVICSTEHHNTWSGARNRYWAFTAFTSCQPPAQPFRICSTFAVEASSGRAKFIGPFCSPLSTPPETITTMRPAP